MEFHLPILKWRLLWLSSYVAENKLRGPVFGVLCIRNSAILVEFQHVYKDRIGLFQCARLTKYTRVIDPFQKRKTNGSVCHPKGESPNRAADRIAEAWHGPIVLHVKVWEPRRQSQGRLFGCAEDNSGRCRH